jgi:hypothetical protein
MFYQNNVTPKITAYSGSGSTPTDGAALGVYAILTGVFNGASSLFQINSNTAVTGNFGAGNPGGITIGADGGSGNNSNIQVKEVLVYNVAHDTTQNAAVRTYLATL